MGNSEGATKLTPVAFRRTGSRRLRRLPLPALVVPFASGQSGCIVSNVERPLILIWNACAPSTLSNKTDIACEVRARTNH